MATVTDSPKAAAPWAAQEAQLNAINQQRERLAERSSAIERRLAELPAAEANARTRALARGEDAWPAIKPLDEERQELEAELASNITDEQALGPKAAALTTQINAAKAEQLDREADEIRDRQKERLARVGSNVQAIADVYEELVGDERALAEMRAEIAETLGSKLHSFAKPVAEPLATSLQMFLDEVFWAATHSAARGQYGKDPAAGPAWLEAIPDLRAKGGTPLVEVEGVEPYYARITGVL